MSQRGLGMAQGWVRLGSVEVRRVSEGVKLGSVLGEAWLRGGEACL